MIHKAKTVTASKDRFGQIARRCVMLAALGGCAATAGAAGKWQVAAGVDYVVTQDTPNIGNIGRFLTRRINHASPSVRIARELGYGWSLELGYRYTPTYAAWMEAGTSAIFPLEPGWMASTVLTPYELSQRTHTVSCGPTWSFALSKRLRGTVGAFAAFETVGSRIDYLSDTTALNGVVFASASNPVPVAATYTHGRTFEVSKRGDTSYRHSLRSGARLGLEYELEYGWSLEASGTLIDSAGAAGGYVGLGLVSRF